MTFNYTHKIQILNCISWHIGAHKMFFIMLWHNDSHNGHAILKVYNFLSNIKGLFLDIKKEKCLFSKINQYYLFFFVVL